MTAHKHAALMLQYAQDAAETDKPWERWEWGYEDPIFWRDCVYNPVFSEACNYRRKPRTIRIGDMDVPEPLREAPPAGLKRLLKNLRNNPLPLVS